jgi:phosphatidylglycerol---prolipoprotein diacylglyceryl transferase
MLGSRFAYAVLMFVAAGVATLLIRRHQKTLSLSTSQRWTIIGSGFVGATFAAKLPFLIFGQSSGAWWATWLGDGKTILWGLVGGYVGVEIGKAMLEVRTRTGDTFVVGVAVAIAIGRLGCLLFGCCFGTPTDLPWGVRFATAEDQGILLRHPTQIYESLFHLAFAFVAAYGITRDWLKGNWMPVYLIAYCVYRFVSEYIRPEPKIFSGLTFYQISAVIIAIGMSLVLMRRRSMIPAAA